MTGDALRVTVFAGELTLERKLALKVELEVRHGIKVNHKRLRRCLREWDLALKRQVARPRPSGVRKILKEAGGKLNLLRNRKPKPLEVLCTDFTGVRYAGGERKAHLMAMVDPESAWVPGWAVGPRADRELALRCWEAVKEGLAKVGRGSQGLIVHHDTDWGVHQLPVAKGAFDRRQGGGVLL